MRVQGKLWSDPVARTARWVESVESPAAARVSAVACEAVAGATGPLAGLRAWLRATADVASREHPVADSGRTEFLALSVGAMERYCCEIGCRRGAEHFGLVLSDCARLWDRPKLERLQRGLVEAYRNLDLRDSFAGPAGEIRPEGERVRVGGILLDVKA